MDSEDSSPRNNIAKDILRGFKIVLDGEVIYNNNSP